MRPGWRLRRARPRRFPAHFRRRASWRWTSWWRSGGATGRGARHSSPTAFPNHLRADIDPSTASFIDGSVLNNRPFQRGDRGDPWPAGVPRGRPAAGLHRSASDRAAFTARPRGAGLLCDAARRAVRYSELAAGDRGAGLGARSSTSRCGGCAPSSTAPGRRSANWSSKVVATKLDRRDHQRRTA